jgi:hypothetical protein
MKRLLAHGGRAGRGIGCSGLVGESSAMPTAGNSGLLPRVSSPIAIVLEFHAFFRVSLPWPPLVILDSSVVAPCRRAI